MKNLSCSNFITFAPNHAKEALYRYGRQIEMKWIKGVEIGYELNHLCQLMNSRLDLFDQSVIQSLQDLEYLLMKWEQDLGKNLVDSDFLVSTQDSFLPKGRPSSMVLVLDNVRSSFNVGSLFRSAEAFYLQAIHLCGYTPTPDQAKTANSSLGSQEWIEWKKHDNVIDCIEDLKKQNYFVVAMETSALSQPLSSLKPSAMTSVALVLGNERYGLSDQVLKCCDQIVHIPLSGRKNSLNVAICGAIGIYHWVSNGGKNH